jgi:O-succinylbenzoic acid--CoA ligase
MTSDALDASIDDDRWMLCLPVAHMGGLSIVTRSLITGVPVTTLPAFDRQAVETAAARGATLVSLVPSALPGLDVSAFRAVLLGGSAIPTKRPANSVVTYGLTESAGGVVYDGRALSCVELAIDEGRVMMRSPSLLRTYRFGSDPKTAQGWLPTGDLGELSDDGTLTIFGRADDVIISGGHNVFPALVEDAVRSHGSVADVAVVGRDDPKWRSAVTAIVVPSDPANPPTLDVIRGWAKAQVPFYAAPTRLELVDALPQTALGKVRRRDL